MIIWVLTFSLIGIVLFASKNLLINYLTFIETDEVNTFMQNFEKTFFSLFVLMTTANYPDVMLPAYKDYRSSFIFFFIYLIGAFIIFSNMIIANFFHTF